MEKKVSIKDDEEQACSDKIGSSPIGVNSYRPFPVFTQILVERAPIHIQTAS